MSKSQLINLDYLAQAVVFVTAKIMNFEQITTHLIETADTRPCDRPKSKSLMKETVSLSLEKWTKITFKKVVTFLIILYTCTK